MKRLACILWILFISIGCTQPSDILQSTVIIDNVGSGTIIKVQPFNERYDQITILTASHILFDENPVIIRYDTLTFGWIKVRDVGTDIALIVTIAPKGKCKAIPLGRKLPKIGDDLWYCGYPGMVHIIIRGTMNEFHDPYASIISLLDKGASGGGVYNDKFELVGIIHGYIPIGKQKIVGLFVPVLKQTVDWYEKHRILHLPVKWVPTFVPTTKPVSEWY